MVLYRNNIYYPLLNWKKYPQKRNQKYKILIFLFLIFLILLWFSQCKRFCFKGPIFRTFVFFWGGFCSVRLIGIAMQPPGTEWLQLCDWISIAVCVFPSIFPLPIYCSWTIYYTDAVREGFFRVCVMSFSLI